MHLKTALIAFKRPFPETPRPHENSLRWPYREFLFLHLRYPYFDQVGAAVPVEVRRGRAPLAQVRGPGDFSFSPSRVL